MVELEDGGALRGRTVIVATGARYRKLDVPDLERYEANGVFYAATQVEAQQCAGDPVLIVGGGNSAGQAALFVSEYAGSCSLMIRGEELEKSMSSYLVDQLFRSPRVQLIRSSEVAELCGETGLEAVTIRDRRTGELRSLPVKAAFVFIGAAPGTEWLRGRVSMDAHGFLRTGRDVDPAECSPYDGHHPLFLETSLRGVFAVGDVHSGSVKRVASAVGEGSMAVRLVHERLAETLAPWPAVSDRRQVAFAR